MASKYKHFLGKNPLGLFALLLAMIGVLALVNTQAAPHVTSAEAEAGSIIATAKSAASPAASGGNAVQFGTNTPLPTTGRSIKDQPLYIRTSSEAAGRPQEIYSQARTVWFGDWTVNISSEVGSLAGAAAAVGKLPLMVAYNIPGRDCGSYSQGGAGNSANYRSWVRNFASGLGNRKAIIVLEPDALSQVSCLSVTDQNTRINDIAYAVNHFKTQTQASVYIDGGNASWLPAEEMVSLLGRAGIANAAGFSMNVSNFHLNDTSINYSERVVQGLIDRGIANTRYVVDTSRNGRGPAPAAPLSWCNPAGRGLGKRPTTSPAAGAHNDAYLWIKIPGESDGECGRGDPPAGQWFPSYARMLVDNAVY